MKRSEFNDNGIAKMISFPVAVFVPFKRIFEAVFIVLSPLISILTGSAELMNINRQIGKWTDRRVKK